MGAENKFLVHFYPTVYMNSTKFTHSKRINKAQKKTILRHNIDVFASTLIF